MITARWSAVCFKKKKQNTFITCAFVTWRVLIWCNNADNHLSLVVLDVEERVLVRQFDHLGGMFGGFVDDGQVEKPVRKVKTLVKIVHFI